MMTFVRNLKLSFAGSTRDNSPTAPLGIAIAMGVALAFILSAFLYMSRETGNRIGDMRTAWQSYSSETTPRGYWISDIREYFGYGGLIHNFKNYLLRHDPDYGPTLRQQARNLLTTIEVYRKAEPSQAEQRALDRIEWVAHEYTGNIPKIEAGIAAGLKAEEIDTIVRVDDRDALAALATLEQLWIAERDQSLSGMVRAFSEGERLVRNFSVFLVGLIVVVGVIAILTTLLIANILRTNHRLQAERVSRNLRHNRSSNPTVLPKLKSVHDSMLLMIGPGERVGGEVMPRIQSAAVSPKRSMPRDVRKTRMRVKRA